MASTTKAISFCEFCVYFSLFFILCPNLTYSTGCQFNQEIKVDYQRSICQIPSNYSLFNDQFHQGIYRCDAQQWLICMEEGLGQGIRDLVKVNRWGWGTRLNVYPRVSTCQVPTGIDRDYVQSICGIPHTYSIFNTDFEREFYRCHPGADQWLICMDSSTLLGQKVRNYVYLRP